MSPIFQGSDEQLTNAIEKGEEQLTEKEMLLKTVKCELQQYQTKNETTEKAKSSLLVRRTRLEDEVKAGYQAFYSIFYLFTLSLKWLCNWVAAWIDVLIGVCANILSFV